jgi:hypothetical protein
MRCRRSRRRQQTAEDSKSNAVARRSTGSTSLTAAHPAARAAVVADPGCRRAERSRTRPGRDPPGQAHRGRARDRVPARPPGDPGSAAPQTAAIPNLVQRNGLRDHQHELAPSPRRPGRPGDPRALADRVPALDPRRHLRRGPAPDPHRQRPRGYGHSAQHRRQPPPTRRGHEDRERMLAHRPRRLWPPVQIITSRGPLRSRCTARRPGSRGTGGMFAFVAGEAAANPSRTSGSTSGANNPATASGRTAQCRNATSPRRRSRCGRGSACARTDTGSGPGRCGGMATSSPLRRGTRATPRAGR